MIIGGPLSENLSEKLVDFIINEGKSDPLKMAEMQIILPTRRACRTVREAFLKRSETQAMLLPKMMPLYELDDLSVHVPQAISPLERTLLLAKLCHAKSSMGTPDQAFKIALSLGELLDEFYQFETDVSKLSDLVPSGDFSIHWNETLIFLDIIRTVWPQILAEKGMIDEADRRVRIIDAYTNRLKQDKNTFVIAAGLDSGFPVVQRLLNVIDKRKKGLIWIDGIDTQMGEKEINALPTHHYQNHIRQILSALNKSPADVRISTPGISSREKWITEAFKPENRTEEWRQSHITEKVLNNITRFDCSSDISEAVMVSLLLRQVLETPKKTAVFVTPDRTLARRVISEMRRWGIVLDDSAGQPLTQTNVGVFLKLSAAAALSNGKPSDILALLKHPLAADGKNPTTFRLEIKAYEKKVRQNKELFQPDIKTNLFDFFSLFQRNVLTPFKELLVAHIQAVEALATSHDRTGSERLWSDDAGQAAFALLTELCEKADLIGDIEPAFYSEILTLLMGSISIRPKYGMHPRLDILGPIEARFHHADVCIIGGLNEGIFPSSPDIGPWLNRTMRATLGLPLPESKVATNASDFAHCFCGQEVYLTRSLKSGGTQTIPSRFLSRLEAVLEAKGIQWPIKGDEIALLLDAPTEKEEVIRPCPKPPVSARPNKLSVTKIELWMRNPYAIYARYILKLFPLDPLESNQKSQVFGSAVHKILERYFTENFKDNNKKRLMVIAIEEFKKAGLNSVDMAFYRPRFEQMANFIIDRQMEGIDDIEQIVAEETGEWTFDVAGKPFTLTGKPDRVDILKNGTVRIVDYKTGGVPSIKEVTAGYAPQLPLEGLIIANNGFKNIPAHPISQMVYWKLAGKTTDCKTQDILGGKNALDGATLVAEHLEGVKALIHAFNQEETGYEVCPVAGKSPQYNDYEYLARSAEWSQGDDDTGEDNND